MDTKIQAQENHEREINFQHIINETPLKIGSSHVWIWVAIEPKTKEMRDISISNEGNMLIAERFILSPINKCGKHSISTDGGGTWYPQACRFQILQHQV